MTEAPITTVDCVLLTLRAGALHVALLRREAAPFKGALALPGGYVHPAEDVDALAAARRVLREKADVVPPYLEQLCTFAGSGRDPRGWSISIAHYALVHEAVLGARPTLVPVDELPQLPFDHGRIVETAVHRVRDKSSYSTLPCYLLPPTFTLSALQRTYEQVLGVALDKSQFRRRIAEWSFLEEVPGAFSAGKGRPAQLYRIRPRQRLELFDRTV